MKIYVIRHGLTELNKKKILNGQIDEPLSEEGFKQARKAISLIPKTVKVIYTSPLSRAKKTAEIINSKFNYPIFEHKKIAEIHMGSVAGKGWIEMENGMELKYKHRSIQFNYHPQGGESAADVKKRVLEFVKEIKGKYRDYEVLIVTHGGIVRVLRFLEKGETTIDDIENTSLHEFDLSKILERSNP